MADSAVGFRVASAAFLVWLLTVISLVAWRQGAIYSGGADSVVVAKALIQCVGLLIASVLLAHTPIRQPLGGRSWACCC